MVGFGLLVLVAAASALKQNSQSYQSAYMAAGPQPLPPPMAPIPPMGFQPGALFFAPSGPSLQFGLMQAHPAPLYAYRDNLALYRPLAPRPLLPPPPPPQAIARPLVADTKTLSHSASVKQPIKAPAPQLHQDYLSSLQIIDTKGRLHELRNYEAENKVAAVKEFEQKIKSLFDGSDLSLGAQQQVQQPINNEAYLQRPIAEGTKQPVLQQQLAEPIIEDDGIETGKLEPNVMVSEQGAKGGKLAKLREMFGRFALSARNRLPGSTYQLVETQQSLALPLPMAPLAPLPPRPIEQTEYSPQEQLPLEQQREELPLQQQQVEQQVQQTEGAQTDSSFEAPSEQQHEELTRPAIIKAPLQQVTEQLPLKGGEKSPIKEIKGIAEQQKPKLLLGKKTSQLESVREDESFEQQQSAKLEESKAVQQQVKSEEQARESQQQVQSSSGFFDESPTKTQKLEQGAKVIEAIPQASLDQSKLQQQQVQESYQQQAQQSQELSQQQQQESAPEQLESQRPIIQQQTKSIQQQLEPQQQQQLPISQFSELQQQTSELGQEKLEGSSALDQYRQQQQQLNIGEANNQFNRQPEQLASAPKKPIFLMRLIPKKTEGQRLSIDQPLIKQQPTKQFGSQSIRTDAQRLPIKNVQW